ncbi:hypothetical protein PILCRDRAFT_78511 [Piloderma croceum F 1598]|uniref:PARP catalytic domain-containing protein n=1 Tax=Piloderma croceum (strain F 1598) TaxID=765440 RepID=A0A0C3F7E1_PILCF|nr:hypothetical protein PILCRDRAFT_78511 [Piloderma croceum F 1598]
MCCIHHKNGRFDFCGIACRDKAKDLAPLLLDVPKGHTTFTKVEGEFQKSWKPAVNTLCPPVRQVYRVVESSALLNTYTEYRLTHGNEHFRYHGTKRNCKLGDKGHTKICTSSLCSACSIIKTSFEVSLANPSGVFGKGVYTSSVSNKSANYCDSSRSGVMFLTKVILGNIHDVTRFAEVDSCPSGKQSVYFDRPHGDEAVVYTNDAIRPVFLIVFG